MTLRFSRFAGWFCLGILSVLAIVLIGCSRGDGGTSAWTNSVAFDLR